MACLSTGDVSKEDLKEQVKNFLIYPLDMHSFSEAEPGPLTVIDMPILPMSEHGVVKCFVDVIMDVEVTSKNELKQALQSRAFGDLPVPFGITLAPEVIAKLDIAMVRQPNSRFIIVKIINLRDKIRVSEARNLCHGKAHSIDWSGEVRTMKKIFHFVFENLGGFQCRHHIMRSVEEGKPEQERSQEEWDFGFDHIDEHGPRENTKNRQLRWITSQITCKDSPIYKWPTALVEKSLRNLAQDGVLAQVHEDWPLTLYDLDIRFLKSLGPLFASLSEKSQGFHGVPGAGKTPAARSVAMALSRYQIRKANKTGEVKPVKVLHVTWHTRTS